MYIKARVNILDGLLFNIYAKFSLFTKFFFEIHFFLKQNIKFAKAVLGEIIFGKKERFSLKIFVIFIFRQLHNIEV
jgi:hypothetical protein